MIDFSQIKAWGIEEGSVKEVAVNGVKIWSKTPSIKYVTCVKATGTQYTRIPVKFKGTMRVELNLRIDKKGGEVIFGCRYGAQVCVFKYNSTGTWLIQTTNGHKQIGVYLVGIWYHIVVDFKNKMLTINGGEYPFAPYTFASVDKDMMLCAFDNNGEIQYPASISIKDIKVSEDANVLCNYKAALDQFNRPALYDEINNNYIYSLVGDFDYEE